MIHAASGLAPVHARSGYTLVELLIGLAVLSILLLAMQSASLIAARSIPNPASASAATNAGARAIDRICADITYALSVTRSTATEVEFTVPDRNGDGTAETIAYCWSGTPGDPLIYRINGTATTLIPRVQQFQLAYDKRATELPPTSAESGEQELVKHVASGSLFSDYRITSSSWAAQYFKPTLPAGTTTWRITRASFNARLYNTNKGVTKVQVRTTSGGLPTSTVLEEVALSEAGLASSYQPVTVSFTKLSGLSPASGLCLVMQWSPGDTEACAIRYQLGSTTSNGTYMITTSSGGYSWTPQSLWDIPFTVWGTTSSASSAGSQYWLTHVRCSLQAGPDAASRIATSVRTLNEPEVTGP